jgi:glycosyltransferase involved in cell wall biosynthesis
MSAKPLVTIALPVLNGADTLGDVARCAFQQDYENIELLITDNASTDGTEEIGRELARTDKRVRYHRQPRNIGLIGNFEWTKRHCRGTYLRWIGDNDEILPSYVSRCLELYAEDPRLVLVTTQLRYIDEHGKTASARYHADAMRSDDAVVRLKEVLRLLTSSYLLLDPLYGMARVDAVKSIVHDQMLRGDEVYATKLALAGPWGHVPEILGSRRRPAPQVSHLVTLLEVPWWHSRIRGIIEIRRMLEVVSRSNLSPTDARRAKAAVRSFFLRQHWTKLIHRGRRCISSSGRRDASRSNRERLTGALDG